jgi:16S rRNA (guanine966-N2)-methyltransferase
MKDRVREAVFNLIREEVQGRQVIDLFAGTGALGLEAISRGAAQAVLIEKHLPTAATIRRNVDALGVGEQARVVAADAFAWAARPTVLGSQPWLVFCSPPYELYVSNKDAMLRMLGDLLQRAPHGSRQAV